MTSDERKDGTGLGHGLPRLWSEDPEKLNDMLGLRRQERLRIGKLVPKEVRARIDAQLNDRAEPVKPGERDRILVQFHYGHPGIRRAAWHVALEQGPGSKPSPEATVLADFVDAERETAADAAETSADDGTESERIAGRAWADTQERLRGWDALDQAERERCLLQTFAVATIRDDPAILTEAIEIAPALANQFENLLAREEPEEETKKGADSSSGPSGAVTDEWTALTGSLKHLVSQAEDPPPNPGLLDEIARAVESLRGLEPAVRAEISCAAFEEFFGVIRRKLDEVQAESVFWLDASRRESLEKAWESWRISLRGDALDEESRRFQSAVAEASDGVRAADRELTEAKEEIRAHRDREPADPFVQGDWSDALAHLQERERTCRRRHRDAQSSLLKALSPRGQSLGISKPATKEKSPEPSPPDPPSPGPATPPRRRRPKPPTRPQPAPAPVPRPARDPIAIKAGEAIGAALKEEPPRLAYAFQTARLVERVFPDEPKRSPLLEAALLADRLRDPEGAIAMGLKDVFAEVPAPDPDWSDEQIAFQATARFAACLRPALFAPLTAAYSVFSSLPRSSRYPALNELGHRLKEHAAKLQSARVDPSFLRALHSEADREAARERCRAAISGWIRDAPRKTMPYQPATAVWQRWVQATGEIGRVMGNPDVRAADGQPIPEVVSQWKDRAWVEKTVAATDRKMRGALHPGAGIRFKALDRIVAETRKAAELMHRYLDLNAASSGPSDFRVKVLSGLRSDLERHAPAALEELASPAQSPNSWAFVGARLAAHAIERLRRTLDAQLGAQERATEPTPTDLLASGFFPTGIALDRDDQPIGAARELLLSLIEEPRRPLEGAVRPHLESGDVFLAKRMLDWAEQDDGTSAPDLREELEGARRQHRNDLRNELRRQRERIESGLMLGIVSADGRERLDPVLVECERHLENSDFLRFRDVRDRLEGTKTELDEMEGQHLQKVGEDFEDLALSKDSRQARGIRRAISSKDIVTANELIQQVKTDPDFVIPEFADRDILSEFFPERAKSLSEEVEKLEGVKAILDRVRQGKLFGDVPGARRDSAVRMLEAWYALKRLDRFDRETEALVRRLFTEIGFVVKGVEATPTVSNACVMETVPLEGRDQSPVPVYGSGARGRYRVVCFWNRPPVEDLLLHTHQRNGGPPPIALYFGRLSERQRRQLASDCREREETLVVLDETLLLFLCGERGGRLPGFLDCALPFTHVMPYHTQGGLAPPEMFYGRARETGEIRDPRGPCFIYGGRQLGKTAILRAVEQREHRPAEGRYARFVDLRGHGFEGHRDTAEIWPMLWKELRAIAAIPVDVKQPATKSGGQIDAFLSTLVSRFAPSSGRTLLLLLDEADAFLEEDARERQSGFVATGYRESIRLKKLMDDTSRSIKVVFAGLHNVLRTSEQANHPLGQFGRPIQVGPLLRNGEMRAARALLIRPLLAAGYQLPEDLVTRILAQTNYYPSLIQLYGEALINAMSAEARKGAPPYVIGEEVLDNTYRVRGLQRFIRDRFQLTLNLDKRYEVIAYSIARLATEDGEVIVRGISRERIHAEVLEWWSPGFADTGVERFESLLEEMDGLGVLRQPAPNTFALRNPNVLLLMGTKAHIEEKLLEDREPPQEFKPRILRDRRKPEEPDDPSRSPLTVQQRERLFTAENGVVLLSGAPAAGLNDVLDVFGSHRDRSFVRLEGVPDQEFFRSALRGSVKRQPDGRRVHAVPAEIPWTADWIRDAQGYLKSLRRSNRYVRVLFLAGGDHLLALMRGGIASILPKLEWIYLEPWRDGFVRHWMQDVGIEDSAELRGEILEMTGGWPALLMRFYELTRYHQSSREGLEELGIELSDRDQQREWREQLCLGDPVTRAVLRPLVDYGEDGELRREEIVDVASEAGVARQEVELRLRWAHRLGLVQQGLRWKINSVVGRLVGEGPAA